LVSNGDAEPQAGAAVAGQGGTLRARAFAKLLANLRDDVLVEGTPQPPRL
jgi:hypothetical protein